MCGIGGFSSSRAAYTEEPERWQEILKGMNQVQKRRGPDEEGTFLEKRCGLAHVRLSIIDLKRGRQPMAGRAGDKTCAIAFNGEIYNMKALRRELERKGTVFATSSDTEVILQGYLREGEGFIKKLNGIFAIALWDQKEEALYLFRDQAGVKPLFYTIQGDTLVFSSEIKGLFQYPGVEAAADRESLCEIFALGPAKSYGKGVFRNILEVEGGSRLLWKKGRLKTEKYWQLQSLPHEESFEETVEKTSWLVEDAVKLQMLSDIPICTFLSGGVDSSLVTAICARELKKQGKYQDTLIIFTSDNGSRGDHGASNHPLKGRKFTTWEGGMRVPMIMCWEGHIPGGQVCRSIISHIDLLPTLASLIGESLGEKKIDGVDCLEIMP